MLAHFTRPRLRPAIIITAISLIIAAVVALIQVGVVGASQEPALALVVQGQAQVGSLITVKVVGRNTNNLAGFQGVVRYDAAHLRLTGATVDNALSRTGRGLLPLGPVLRDGEVVLGAATCPVSDCATTQAPSTRRSSQGVSGQVELGTLSFYSTAPGNYTLTLDGVQFVDPQGNRLPVLAESMVLEVRDR
jgi:hypothetical protein